MEVRGHQLLGKFKGVEIRSGNVPGFHSGMRQSLQLDDEESLRQARAVQDDMTETFKRRSAAHNQSIACSSTEVPKVNEMDIDHFVSDMDRESPTVMDKLVLKSLHEQAEKQAARGGDVAGCHRPKQVD